MNKRIWLSLAHMGGREQDFIKEAFDTNWVVPLGPNVDAFEQSLVEYLHEDRYVVALSAGTAALHLGLILLDVKPGDEVIFQSFTFAASSNPISYMDEIMDIAGRYGIPVLEDAAEALGSELNGRKCGTFGELAALSFNGNKMITTSGGGALICRTEEEARQTKFYATQARDAAPHYQHTHIGYNYRMSNICAGIGRGQMFVLDEHIARRRAIHSLYVDLLKDVAGITVMENPDSRFASNFWLTCILVDPKLAGKSREDIRLKLDSENIETRPLWKPMHLQPVFTDAPFYGNGTSERLFDIGLCLPSGPTLTDEDIRRVVDMIR